MKSYGQKSYGAKKSKSYGAKPAKSYSNTQAKPLEDIAVEQMAALQERAYKIEEPSFADSVSELPRKSRKRLL